jgi:hypothetical protein
MPVPWEEIGNSCEKIIINGGDPSGVTWEGPRNELRVSSWDVLDHTMRIFATA